LLPAILPDLHGLPSDEVPTDAINSANAAVTKAITKSDMSQNEIVVGKKLLHLEQLNATLIYFVVSCLTNESRADHSARQ